MFHFTCNESKIYESFTFWNKLQEKNELFHDILIYWDAPSVSHTLIYLWRPATISTSTATNTQRPLPSAPASHTHEHDFRTRFTNFQTLLAAFFP